MTPRIICLGEGMVEERRAADGTAARSFGGDTLNAAIHLARLGCDVAFATALGSDAESANLCAAWAKEGVDTSLVLEHPQRRAGRYRIELDESGERSFSYDRSESAARVIFEIAEEEWPGAVAHADLLFFSLISLAVLPERDRAKLLDLAARARSRGGQVAFDGNYRPALWDSAEQARLWRDRAIAVADFGLPTLDDETALGEGGDAASVARHWTTLGCREVVVKQGKKGCLLADGTVVLPPESLSPLDTSGAGDAFGAGYLAARLQGANPSAAAVQGHRIAGWTIMRAGAIPPRGRDYPAPD